MKHENQQASDQAANKTSNKKKKGNRKLVVAVAILIAAAIIVGIAAYATGLFSKSGTGKSSSISTEEAAQSPVLKSKEYEAVKAYNQYLEDLSDEETEKVTDSSEDAVYDVPAKVKELCEKSGLKFATKKKGIESYEELEKELGSRKLTGVLNDDLTQALKTTMEDYEGGNALDDGNLYLEIEKTGKSEEEADTSISLNFSPVGTFPWKAYSFDMGTDGASDPDPNAARFYQFSPAKDTDFIGTTELSDGTAFGKAGKYYVTMTISKDLSEKESDAYEKAQETRDQKIKKETGLDGMDELEEKVSSGLEAASKEDKAALQKAIDNNDAAKYQELQKKYTKASDKEFQLYQECKKELAQYEDKIAVTQKDIETYLKALDFSKLM